jgi:hypothetical protein
MIGVLVRILSAAIAAQGRWGSGIGGEHRRSGGTRGWGIEFDQPIPIVDVHDQRMQDVEAEHAGDLHPGILINRRRIELQDVALTVEALWAKAEPAERGGAAENNGSG